jgi:hypothetical protein
MITVNQSRIRPECIVTLADFVENVHLAFMKENRRRSTHKGYTEIWRLYIKPHALECRLKDVICADVQRWFEISAPRICQEHSGPHAIILVRTLQECRTAGLLQRDESGT